MSLPPLIIDIFFLIILISFIVAPDSNSSFVILILSVSVILMFDRALYKGAGRSADPPPLIRTRTNSFFWAFFTAFKTA